MAKTVKKAKLSELKPEVVEVKVKVEGPKYNGTDADVALQDLMSSK